MIGLLWKDLKIMKMQVCILFGLFILFAVYAVRDSGNLFPMNFMMMMPIFFTLLPCSSLAQEQQENTTTWLLTLPCSRKNMVLEKYVLLIVYAVATGVICGLVVFALTKSGTNMLQAMLFSAIGVLTQCVLIPLYYKIGYQKAKFVFMILCGLTGGICGVFSNLEIQLFSQRSTQITFLAVTVACFLLLPLSMICSVKWMEKGEY